MTDMRKFCSILIFEESVNLAADNKFLVWIYTISWNRTYNILYHVLTNYASVTMK